MKYLVAFIFVWVINDDITKIARVNKLKTEAQTAFTSHDYETAVKKYALLYDSMGIREDEVILNLSHALMHSGDTTQAEKYYAQITESDNHQIKSLAHQQLGVIYHKKNKNQNALEHFKNSLRANPNNEEARYNYEVLKKLLEEQQDQNQDQDQEQNEEQNKEEENKEDDSKNEEKKKKEEEEQKKEEQQPEEEDKKSEEENKDQQESETESEQNNKPREEEQKDSQDQEQANESEEENKESQQEQINKRLEEMKISPERARMLLQNLKNNEIQYIQQQQREPAEKPDSNKPDW